MPCHEASVKVMTLETCRFFGTHPDSPTCRETSLELSPSFSMGKKKHDLSDSLRRHQNVAAMAKIHQ